MQRARIRLGYAFAALLLAACSDPTGSEPTRLIIEPGADAHTLRIGSQIQLTAYEQDARGRRGDVVAATWTSSNPDVATIDATGKLRVATTYTACDWVTPGLCTVEISARSAALQGSQRITVVPYEPTVTLNTSEINLEMGDSARIIASALLELRPVPWCAVSFSSRDSTIARVHATSGVVIGMDQGSTVVDVQFTGPVCPASPAHVQVVNRPPLYVLTILPAIATVAPGDSLQLSAQVTNWKGVQYGALYVRWSSSNPEVATVENGLVRAAFCRGGSLVCRTTITARSGLLTATKQLFVE